MSGQGQAIITRMGRSWAGGVRAMTTRRERQCGQIMTSPRRSTGNGAPRVTRSVFTSRSVRKVHSRIVFMPDLFPRAQRTEIVQPNCQASPTVLTDMRTELEHHGREVDSSDVRPSDVVSASDVHALFSMRRLYDPANLLQYQENFWWAHKGSNLGPAD